MASEMKDYAALKYAANTIRDEVEDGRNTAERVGTALLNLVEAANADIAGLKDETGDAVHYTEGTTTFNDF